MCVSLDLPFEEFYRTESDDAIAFKSKLIFSFGLPLCSHYLPRDRMIASARPDYVRAQGRAVQTNEREVPGSLIGC